MPAEPTTTGSGSAASRASAGSGSEVAEIGGVLKAPALVALNSVARMQHHARPGATRTACGLTINRRDRIHLNLIARTSDEVTCPRCRMVRNLGELLPAGACPDCGMPGERLGHMGCQFPGFTEAAQ